MTPKYKVGDILVITKDCGERFMELYHDGDWSRTDIFEVDEISIHGTQAIVYWSKNKNSGIYEEAVELASPLVKALK